MTILARSVVVLVEALQLVELDALVELVAFVFVEAVELNNG